MINQEEDKIKWETYLIPGTDVLKNNNLKSILAEEYL